MKHIVLTILTTGLLAGCANYTPNSSAAPTVSKTSAMQQTSYVSTYSFEETETRLRAALDKRGLKLFTTVDHGQGAKSVGQDISQNKLFIFGNPKSGTPLMVANREMGLELPLKALIFTDADGRVIVVTSDIAVIAARRGIATTQSARIEKIGMTLRGIATETTQ